MDKKKKTQKIKTDKKEKRLTLFLSGGYQIDTCLPFPLFAAWFSL